MANELAISMNPMRLAQFSWNLLASTIAGIIPLSIRATRNPNDKEASREILAMLNNKLYQARDSYYAAITLGMVQGDEKIFMKKNFPLAASSREKVLFWVNFSKICLFCFEKMSRLASGCTVFPVASACRASREHDVSDACLFG